MLFICNYKILEYCISHLFYILILLHSSSKCVNMRKNSHFLFCFECVNIFFLKVRILVLIFFFFPVCLLSCESDWSIAVILPKEGTNGFGLLDKSMQTDCILSLDRIMEGLLEVPHSFSYWLWRGFCNGVLFPMDKKVLWLVTFLMKALQKEMQNVSSAVFSIWQLFLLSFFPHRCLAYFRKHTFWSFFFYIMLSSFHAFDPLEKLYYRPFSFFRLLL